MAVGKKKKRVGLAVPVGRKSTLTWGYIQGWR